MAHKIHSDRLTQLKAYNESEAGKARTQRYRQSKKFKETQKRYVPTQKMNDHRRRQLRTHFENFVKDIENGLTKAEIQKKYNIDDTVFNLLLEKWNTEYGL